MKEAKKRTLPRDREAEKMEKPQRKHRPKHTRKGEGARAENPCPFSVAE